MDFRLDDGQLALQEGVSSFCAGARPLEGVIDLEDKPLTRAEWDELADLGVFSLVQPEAGGGLGLGWIDAVVVFEQLGRFLVRGPVVWSALAPAHLGASDGLTGLTGLTDLTDLTGIPSPYPVVAGWDALADPHGPVVIEHLPDADVLLVLGADHVSLVDVDELARSAESGPAGVRTRLDGIDPLTSVGRLAQVPTGQRVGDGDAAALLRARGAVLTAALQVGIADRAVETARDYSLEREQFGVPIGSFQALKHIMADMFVRTNLARSAVYAAAAVLDDPVVGDLARSVSAAKLLAGDAAIDNSRAAVQVLGGMGFTWDMLPNFLLKRAWVLEEQFGTASSHATSIGRALAAEVA